MRGKIRIAPDFGDLPKDLAEALANGEIREYAVNVLPLRT